MPKKWNKAVEHGERARPSVPLRGGTRKKFVPLFSLPCSTPKSEKKREKPMKNEENKRFYTKWNNWNKWNNKYKKYLWSWRNRLFLQEYKDYRKSAFQSFHLFHSQKIIPKARMECDGTRCRDSITTEDRVGIGDADAGGYRRELNSNEEGAK